MNTTTLAQTFSSTKTKFIAFPILLTIVLVVPSIIHSQWITGPLVNAILIIATILIGPMEAVLLGLAPSTVALTSGLLPIVLAPMVPFIMIGNAILVATFYYLRKKFTLGVLVGALLKFVFLYGAVTLLMSHLLDKIYVTKLSIMMGWPQFATALIGGIIAYGFLKAMKKI